MKARRMSALFSPSPRRGNRTWLFAFDGRFPVYRVFLKINEGQAVFIAAAHDGDVGIGEQFSFRALEIGDGYLVIRGGADEFLLRLAAAVLRVEEIVEIDRGQGSFLGPRRRRGGLQGTARLDGLDVRGVSLDGGVFGLRFAIRRGDFAGADLHLQENGVDGCFQLVNLLPQFEAPPFEPGARDVVFQRIAEDESRRGAGAAGGVLPAEGVRVIAAGQASDGAFQHDVEFRQEFVALHFFADGRGAKLEEGLVYLGPVLKRVGGRFPGVHRRRGQHQPVARDEFHARRNQKRGVAGQRLEAVLRVADGGFGADEVRAARSERGFGPIKLRGVRVDLLAGAEFVGQTPGLVNEHRLLQIRDAGGVERPVRARDLEEMRFALADELVHRDLRVELRDAHRRAVVTDARSFEQRLHDRKRERGGRLRIRQKVDGVVLQAAHFFGERDLRAGDEFLVQPGFERPFILFETIRSARGEDVADRVVFMFELALEERLGVESALRFLDARFADDRQIAKDADLLRVPQRPNIEVFDGYGHAGVVADGGVLPADPPRREIRGHARFAFPAEGPRRADAQGSLGSELADDDFLDAGRITDGGDFFDGVGCRRGEGDCEKARAKWVVHWKKDSPSDLCISRATQVRNQAKERLLKGAPPIFERPGKLLAPPLLHSCESTRRRVTKTSPARNVRRPHPLQRFAQRNRQRPGEAVDRQQDSRDRHV